MAAQAIQETVPVMVEAVATRVGDRWVIDVREPRRLSVRVEKLEDVDAAVLTALARRQVDVTGSVVDVHIYWYR